MCLWHALSSACVLGLWCPIFLASFCHFSFSASFMNWLPHAAVFSLSSNFKHNIQIHPNTQILISFGIWITFGESSLDYQIAGQTDPRFWKSMSLSTPQQPKTAQRFDDFGGRGMTQQPGTAGVSNSHGQSPLPFEPGGPRKRRGHDGHTIGSWKSTSIMSENGDLIGFNGIHIYIYENIYIYIYIYMPHT